MTIRESQEDYLETILILEKRLGDVRSIDIANELDFSRASVSRAMSLLKDKELITMDTANYIHLTSKGKEIATAVHERHQVLAQFFVFLGVTPNVAFDDACRVEHVISEETFLKFKEHIIANNMFSVPLE